MFTGPKIQAKIPRHSGDCFWRGLVLGPPSNGSPPSPSKGYSVQHDHGTRHERSHGILLQNASSFLLQNAMVLLQNVTFIINCDSNDEENAWEPKIQTSSVFDIFQDFDDEQSL